MTSWIDKELGERMSLVEWLRATERAEGRVERLSHRLAACLRQQGRILSCGNGGSMCDAMHLAEELSGRFRQDRAALPAQAISDPAFLSCIGNDWGFERVFARGVEAWGRAGDVLVVFSTSGQSRNVIAAAETARARGLRVVGLLGRDGGVVRALCDDEIVVPSQDSGRVQEVHITIVHLLIEGIERLLASEGAPG